MTLPLINFLIILFPIIIILVIFYIISDDKHEIDNKNIISKIINLTQQVEHIKLNLKIFLDKKNIYSDINDFGEDIIASSSLSYNQYVLLKYIETLEELYQDWDILATKNLIDNSMIKSPYIIAYHIREILKTTIIEDDDGNPIVWLNKDEKACIKKSKHFYIYDNNKSKETLKLNHESENMNIDDAVTD
jgi:hypothetical protein